MYTCHLFDCGEPEPTKNRWLVRLYRMAFVPAEFAEMRPIPFRYGCLACNGTTPEEAFRKMEEDARRTDSLEPPERMKTRLLAVQSEKERFETTGCPYLIQTKGNRTATL